MVVRARKIRIIPLGRLDAKGQAAWEKRKAASEILVVEGVHMRALPAMFIKTNDHYKSNCSKSVY